MVLTPQVRIIIPKRLIWGLEELQHRLIAGGFHTCAILDNGSLKCWGRNNYGQIGDGQGGWSANNVLTPKIVDLGAGRTAISVDTALYQTCAILDDGSLKCWGYNLYGQIGTGSTSNVYIPFSVTFPVGRTVTSVSMGYYHTCAVLDNGSLNCWGSDSYGQIGTGSSSYVPQYTRVYTSYPSYTLKVTNHNSWFGVVNDIGIFNLEVWYNTTSTSSLHRITVNASFPITYPAYSYVSTVNQSLTITPSKYACDSCILSISPNLPDGLNLTYRTR